MPWTIDLGGAPADADCAQLGRTANFAALNLLEVRVYEAALIARLGPPPSGCRFVRTRNVHDFGAYVTLGLRIDDEADEAARAYANEAEDGLGSWLQAGFTPPVRYGPGGDATTDGRSFEDIVRGALATTRPSSDGRFPIADFALLHANLRAAFPGLAAAPPS